MSAPTDQEYLTAKVVVWTVVVSMLRGDKAAAARSALTSDDPATAVAAAESIVDLMRVHAEVTGATPGDVQQRADSILAQGVGDLAVMTLQQLVGV